MATNAIRINLDITDDDLRAIERVTIHRISIEDWIYSAIVSKLEQMGAYKEE